VSSNYIRNYIFASVQGIVKMARIAAKSVVMVLASNLPAPVDDEAGSVCMEMEMDVA
jgi:hypothetical protein